MTEILVFCETNEDQLDSTAGELLAAGQKLSSELSLPVSAVISPIKHHTLSFLFLILLALATPRAIGKIPPTIELDMNFGFEEDILMLFPLYINFFINFGFTP